MDRLEIDQQVERQQAALNKAQVELQSVTNTGFSDASARIDLAMLEAEVELARIDLELAKLRQSQATLRSPRDGVVLLDRPSEWIGRPVQPGEAIMRIVNPRQIWLQISVAAENMIDYQTAERVRFSLDAKPLTRFSAEIVQSDYEPFLNEQNQLVYRLYARISDSDEAATLALGLRGSGRVYGETVPLIYQILRRPLVAWRSTFG